MTLTAGLVLAVCSAIALNWGWVAQHRAASALPPLSLRRPIRSLRVLFTTPAWLVGFSTGIGGWAFYVAAVALAPLSLVQAVAAGSVGLIALFARTQGSSASGAQLAAIALSIAGLLLLAVSLGSGGVHDRHPATEPRLGVNRYAGQTGFLPAALVPPGDIPVAHLAEESLVASGPGDDAPAVYRFVPRHGRGGD